MQGDSIPANRAFLHVVHGLRVASSIELPDLALADGDTAAGVDVDISEGDVPDSLGDQATVGAHWQTDATRMLFEAPGIARYLVSDGRTIRFQPCASHALAHRHELRAGARAGLDPFGLALVRHAGVPSLPAQQLAPLR